MCNISLARFCFRFAGSLGALSFLMLGGCTILSAPYEYTVVGSVETPGRSFEQVVLPPGAAVDKDSVTFVLEHGDSSPSCLLLKEFNHKPKELSYKSFDISSVYWRDIGKRGTRIKVNLDERSCMSGEESLRKCMRKAGAAAIDAISEHSNPKWAACVKPTPSMEPSFPYTARESLEEDLGFVFASKPKDKSDSISKNTVAAEPSTPKVLQPTTNGECLATSVKTVAIVGTDLIGEACAEVSEHPDQVSSVNLRPGTKICVQAEQRLSKGLLNRSRQASPEHCARFVKGGNGLLAFPKIDQLSTPGFGPYFNAHTTPAIFGVYDWSGIRSHALESLRNAFQLTVYFPQTQLEQDQSWETFADIWVIEANKAKGAGPLILLSGAKQEMPAGRTVKYESFCGVVGGFSCFLFMDRPSVRIMQDIRMGQEVLEADLGGTLGELVASRSLPPVELLRPFRGRPIPVKGSADQVPLLGGDDLRRLYD